MHKRLTIGYFVDRVIENANERIKYDDDMGYYVDGLANDFAQNVSKGIVAAAKDNDANLIVFPGRYFQPIYVDVKRLNYEYQYDHIFQYANENNIDVLLVLMGCVGDLKQQGEKMRLVAELKKRGLPVITIAAKLDEYKSIMYDNVSGFADGIKHLINEHGAKRIGYVSGNKENEDSIIRLNTYKKVLDECSIEYNDDFVKYGNFTEFCEEQVDELLDIEPKLDAIVFANDQMALGGYSVFKRRGIVPGKDILVLGFDNADIAQEMVPSLTTVSADPRKLGIEAVKMCIEYAKNKTIEDKLVPTELLIRESCGCDKCKRAKKATDNLDDEEVSIISASSILATRYANEVSIRSAIERDMMLFDGGSDINLVQIVNRLGYVGIKSSYLFLNEHAKVYRAGEPWVKPRAMFLKTIQNGDNVDVVPPNKQRIAFADVLDSDFYPQDRRYTHIVMPMFMQEEQYGILVGEVDGEDVGFVPSISYQMSLALKFVFMLKKQEEISRKLHESNLVLESVSKRDDLTGVYNRRGFVVAAEALLKVANNHGKQMAAYYADVDYLKTINVQYGHEEGDHALDMSAKVLSRVLGHEGVVGRLGGNAFVAIVPLSEEKNLEYYANEIDKQIDNSNKHSERPYHIGVTLGFTTFECKEDVNLIDILSMAEDSLYQLKYDKARSILM
ncbi:MAG: GGDEF domain-containing protein [Lachnospiraceae bacterium]|nr:GGDEF domain-containing protein [Lachnospiraceae bacterium]